ncbi:MAG: NfeD family protein, partial [Candidatus Riflebacteria bacterium]|nr:NfeD family protein [Candidatus Riflebacteria bacterium]
FPTTAIGKKFVLSSETSVSNDSIAVENYDHLIGSEGVATSMLRPSGIAKINGDRYDVITEGEFIEKNTAIVVKKAEAGRIIVTAKS